MKNQAINRPRGRPKGKTEGAPEALDAVDQMCQELDISYNALALRLRMTPSSVSRAMGQERSQAVLTPTLIELNRNALIYLSGERAGTNSDTDSSRTMIHPESVALTLANYAGPGKPAVERILSDVADLISTLRASER